MFGGFFPLQGFNYVCYTWNCATKSCEVHGPNSSSTQELDTSGISSEPKDHCDLCFTLRCSLTLGLHLYFLSTLVHPPSRLLALIQFHAQRKKEIQAELVTIVMANIFKCFPIITLLLLDGYSSAKT